MVLAVMEQIGTATIRDLTQHVPFCRSTIYDALKELEKAGKIGRSTVRVVEESPSSWRNFRHGKNAVNRGPGSIPLRSWSALKKCEP